MCLSSSMTGNKMVKVKGYLRKVKGKAKKVRVKGHTRKGSKKRK